MPSAGVTTRKVGHIPSLNGLRAIAIAVVVWAHAGFPGHLAGGLGVSLFFFLSGYLITTLLRAEYDKYERISLGGFYLRRALRIFPPMYIVIALVVVLTLVGFLPNVMSAGGTAATALFLTNYWIIFAGHEGVPAGLGVFWSLAVEEHFYLVFPLMYIAMRKWLPKRTHQVVLLVALCVLILGSRGYLPRRVRHLHPRDPRPDYVDRAVPELETRRMGRRHLLLAVFVPSLDARGCRVLDAGLPPDRRALGDRSCGVDVVGDASLGREACGAGEEASQPGRGEPGRAAAAHGAHADRHFGHNGAAPERASAERTDGQA